MKILNNNLQFCAKKIPHKKASYIDSELNKVKTADIICHNMTDKDSANSALLIWDYLNTKGINSRIIMQQKTPELLGLRTLDCNIVQMLDSKKINEVSPDIVFCVDFSDQKRVKPNINRHINKAQKVFGFDHHHGANIITSKDSNLFYVDETAKSTTSVIYRYFEALGQEITNEQAYDIFLGLVDDSTKRGAMSCNGKTGEIALKKEFINDENAFEIYSKVKEKLTETQIKEVAKSVDLASNLNEAQQAFKDSLKDKIKLSENGKIAYVEISPNDPEWKEVGGDNTVTSTILNRFRREILASKEYQDVEIVITFYEANGNYRLSAHTKKPILLDFYKYVENKKIEDFTKNAGGHPTRGGGGISTLNEKECHEWVEKIISCDDFLS